MKKTKCKLNRNKNLIVLMFFFASITTSFAQHVDVITIDGAITVVTPKYIGDAIDRAEKNNAQCLIIEMDTPGGLLGATLDIDKKILSSKVPVIVYISPSGGRAGSAGVFISYSAHIAAMAPSTNIGSAHPVSLFNIDTSKVPPPKS